MLPQIAYVTHGGDTGTDPDIPLALAAFANAGMQAATVSWDDNDMLWDAFDVILMGPGSRLAGRRQEFLRWARDVEDQAELVNPAVTLARNTDLTYLRDLQSGGIATVDTVWLEPGDAASDVEQRLQSSPWARFVVAPSIPECGDQPVVTDSPHGAAQVAAGFAAKGCSGIIGPELGDSCAMAITILGGRISHAVVRDTPNDRWRRQDVELGLVDLVDDIFDVGSHGENLLYARIDLVAGAGGWLVERFEATAPSLFLDADVRAADRLAWAVRERITGDLRPEPLGGSD